MEDPLRRRAIGMFGVALNLALLCYFKYTNFIFDSINTLTGAPLPFFNIVLPLGISFFTFQQIAYLVDVMRGAKVERDIVSYTLFVSFFPHLIAGPLVHHAEMIPQFKRGRTGRSAVLAARGLAIFAAGLFKKVVIADNLAQFVSPVFAHLDAGGGVTTPWAWLATLAYTLQIYFDFSGYSDMAVGLALLFGIRLPVNFRSPYKATSIIEFWRRWHITLSRFLRDYLYIPLGGNRLGEQRRYLNLMRDDAARRAVARRGLEFPDLGRPAWPLSLRQSSLAGWRGDGAAANLVPAATSESHKAFSWAITFFAVVIAWVFFRARTVAGAWQMLGGLFGFEAGSSAYASPGILRLMDLPILVGEERLLADRRRRGGAGARDRAWPAQCSATVRLSRIPPRAGARELAAMAAERGVGVGVGAGAGDLAVRHVAAAGISVFPVLSALLRRAHIAKRPRCIYKRRFVARTGEGFA